jgi:predicted HicB family RNase H-like nuclease
MILMKDGYTAEVTYHEGDDLMHGLTLNTRATLHFAGRTLDELRSAFEDTLADYFGWCADRGVEPIIERTTK